MEKSVKHLEAQPRKTWVKPEILDLDSGVGDVMNGMAANTDAGDQSTS